MCHMYFYWKSMTLCIILCIILLLRKQLNKLVYSYTINLYYNIEHGRIF